jgi:hypothetical protein
MPEDRKKYTKTKPISIGEFVSIKNWWSNRKQTENSWKISIEEVIAREYNLDIKNPSKKLEDFSTSIKDYSITAVNSIGEINSNLTSLLKRSDWKALNELNEDELNLISIGDVLQPHEEVETLIPSEAYGLLGVSLAGRGPFLRETKMGQEIGARQLNKVAQGNFIYSRLFAWKGAFGIIPEELDGCYVSNEFPVYNVDETVVLAEYLSLYFSRPYVWGEVEKYCKGTTKASRNRFKEKYLLAMDIRVPSIETQKKILELNKESKSQIALIQNLLTDLEGISLNVLANIYKGEL